MIASIMMIPSFQCLIGSGRKTVIAPWRGRRRARVRRENFIIFCMWFCCFFCEIWY